MGIVYTKEKIDKILIEFDNIYKSILYKERMLPDIRDGMRIVQRRILWAMLHLPNKGEKLIKSATVVGETIKYHPHGDSSIYQTLVNMVSSNNNLITGKGNWGYKKTVDRSKAAAMRYTECKLNKNCKNYLYYIKWAPTYLNDTNMIEVENIPVIIPYSLICGFYGIVKDLGVSNIPSFKIDDLRKRLRYLINKKFKLNLSDIEDKYYMPYYGDDKLKPSGNIEDLYQTGKCKIRVPPVISINHKDKIIKVKAVADDLNLLSAISSLYNNKKVSPVFEFIDSGSKGVFELIIKYNDKYKKKSDIISFAKFIEIIKQKLTANISYNILVYDEFNKYPLIGIDNWLLLCFDNIVKFENLRLKSIIDKLEKKIKEFTILLLVRPIIKEYLNKYNTLNKSIFEKIKKDIISNLKIDQKLLTDILQLSIKQLLYVDIDIDVLNKEMIQYKNMLNDKSINKYIVDTYLNQL